MFMNKEPIKKSNTFRPEYSLWLTFVVLFVSGSSGVIINFFSSEQLPHLDIWLLTAFAIVGTLFLFIGFLVAIFKENSIKVKELKTRITSSFLDAIDKSSFNPTLKRRHE